MGIEIDGMVIKTSAVTSGSLDMFEACPASAVYQPKIKEAVHPGQWYGIFVHRFLEYVNSRGFEAAVDYIVTKNNRNAKNTCLKIRPESVPQGDTEVSYAHDVVHGLGRRLSPGFYADVQTEMFGKADVLPWATAGDVPHVVDYKCGPVPSDPAGNTQLLGLAESVRKALGYDGPVDTSIMAVRSDGEMPIRTVRVSAMELDDFTARARRSLKIILDDRMSAAIGEGVAYMPGEHCRWCHLRPECLEAPDFGKNR